MTIGKTIALTTQTFFGKVMSLLFNMLSRLVIIFLPRSKHLLISWLQSPSTVILEPLLEPPKIKSLTVSIVSPSICHEVMESDGHDPSFLRFYFVFLSQLFHSFTFIKRLFSSSLSTIRLIVICISKVIHISPRNLDSSLCFIQPGISHDVLCI